MSEQFSSEMEGEAPRMDDALSDAYDHGVHKMGF